MSDGVLRLIPGVGIARSYRRSWLANDLVAGLVLTAILVPVGMGYAQAAGLPAITGLYATIIPLLVYALFGPSPILVLGPDSASHPPGGVSFRWGPYRSMRAASVIGGRAISRTLPPERSGPT